MPLDLEIIDRFQLEPATPLELEWKDRIKPDEYAIYSTKLELICEEAKQDLVNIAVSFAVQAQDCTAGIYTASGDLALAAVGTYLHVCTGQIPIKYIIKHYTNDPTVGVRDGDMFFANESLYGGIHNQDMLNIVPIFYKGELIAWSLVAGHESETGASKPGGYVPNAQSRYEEGLKVPPMKIGENFQLKSDVMDMFVNMVRDERVMRGDTKARGAGCLKIRDRLLELIEEKGPGFVAGLLRKVPEMAADGARAKVRQFNDGVYTCPVFFDIRGYEEGLGRVLVKVIKQDDRITIDLSGSSPPTRSYFNTRPHIVRAVMLGDLAQYLFYDLPASTGILAPFEIKAPAGTVVNPPADVAIAASTRLTPLIVIGIHNCFMKMAFDSDYRPDVACPFGPSGRFVFGGGLNQFGDIASFLSISVVNASGGGARSDLDGVDAAGFFYSGFADSMDAEHEEIQFPFVQLFRNLPMDIGGFGKHRGGHGMAVGFLLRGAKSRWPLIFSPYSSRVPIELGLFGGYAGGMAPCLYTPNGKWDEVFAAGGTELTYSYHETLEKQPAGGDFKLTQILPEEPFQNGAFVAVMGPSGGGYGDVLERDPEAVMADIRRGLTSHGVARNVYQVAYDQDALRVDHAATRALREQERENRKRRGRPYAEFEREWLKRKPSEELTREYGPWPEAIV